jgi:hypothetical protein
MNLAPAVKLSAVALHEKGLPEKEGWFSFTPGFSQVIGMSGEGEAVLNG